MINKIIEDKIKILVGIKESAGDIFITSAIISELKKKYPNSLIYVACDKRFWNILEENPNIKKLLEWHDSMWDYRAYGKWACMDNPFDIVYVPAVTTQRVPSNWLSGKYSVFLGQLYANMCNVPLSEPFISLPDISRLNLPEKYVTVQGKSGQQVKDYDYLKEVIERIKLPVIQMGAANETKISDKVIDFCGKTNFRECAAIIKGAVCHIGADSVMMHFAGHFGTPSVILFGGTTPQAAISPFYKNLNYIETQDRGRCVTSCHLHKCALEEDKTGHKCINNILPETVADKVAEIIGKENVIPEEQIKISSYIIIKDGIKYGFPFEECIKAACLVSDEVVVVDGGSTDGTCEKLQKMSFDSQYFAPADILKMDFYSRLPNDAMLTSGSGWGDLQCKCGAKYRIGSGDLIRDVDFKCLECNNIYENRSPYESESSKIKIFQHPWDLDNPTLFGDEKTYARQKCTGNWLIQLDADEIIKEPYTGAIRDIIKKNKNVELMDFPVINFYGDDEHTRIEDNPYKWRISKNNPNMIHGVHAEARIFDTDKMCISMSKKHSDGCEFVYFDSLKIVPHRAIFPKSFAEVHYAIKQENNFDKYAAIYISELQKLQKTSPIVYHYSWHSLDRKENNGEFWDQTFHGKKEETHNTTKDISSRIKVNNDIIAYTPIKHPLKK